MKKEKEIKKNKGKGIVISIVIIAVILLIILGISLLSNRNTNSQNETNNQELIQEDTSTGIIEPTEHIVEILNEGFVPKTLKIKKGDKVTWINKLATEVRPAGDFHPTHTNYPGSSVIMCGTAEEKNTFDACKGLKKEETYSFVFNEIGSWGYHNHLQPSKDAKVIVEE